MLFEDFIFFPSSLHCFRYLIGCDNELAKLHTRHPDACDKVGGVIIMHINDLRRFALLWLHKTEEVRADTSHWSKNITGDVYESGWISEMYGYSFGAAEVLTILCDSISLSCHHAALHQLQYSYAACWTVTFMSLMIFCN